MSHCMNMQIKSSQMNEKTMNVPKRTPYKNPSCTNVQISDFWKVITVVYNLFRYTAF